MFQFREATPVFFLRFNKMFYLAPQGQTRIKNKKKNPFQVFLEVFLTDNVDNPSQIVSCKHEPDIGAGSFHAFFRQDVMKAPLSLDGTKRMLNNGLAILIFMLLLHYFGLVLFNAGRIFAALDHSAVLNGSCA